MSAKQTEFMPVYDAADLWIDCALRRDGSLFTPGKSIWSKDVLGKARTQFLDKIEEWEGGDFFEKLETVMAGSPPEVYQLMGEAVYVTYLIAHKDTVGQDKKIERIDQAMGGRVAIPHSLHAAQKCGIMNPGTKFNTQFGTHPALVLEFVDKWKEEGLGDELLNREDPEAPWEFKKVVVETELRKTMKGIAYNTPSAQRMALLHLVHPDSFEAISRPKKEDLADAPKLRHHVTKPTNDVDRRIQQIRAALEPKYGSDFVTFFDPKICPLWDCKKKDG